MADTVTRRDFVKTAALATGAAMAGAHALGANGRIRLGAIGVANRGMQIIEGALAQPETEFVALCDVDSTAMDKCASKLPNKVEQYGDYRKLLERDDIDAVLVATPDHWHALICTDACRAGKDVYVEKPLSVTISEGRRMVQVARETSHVVQVGLHRRSAPLFFKAEELVKRGDLGKVSVGTAYRTSNMTPGGIGKCQPCDPPATLDWDRWLGPRAFRPYQPNITPYKFRWWKEYSSQIGNWGVHYFDLMRWVVGEEAPVAVTALGGKFVVDDDRTIPDTMQATFEFASGRIFVFGQYEGNGGPYFVKNGLVELRGANGTLIINDNGYEVIPDKGGQFQDGKAYMEPVKYTDPGGNANHTALHMRNFFDCIVSREKPTCDVEIGHRSTTFAHLANIALETKARLEWDAENERVTNNDAANALLGYEYRAPWKLS